MVLIPVPCRNAAAGKLPGPLTVGNLALDDKLGAPHGLLDVPLLHNGAMLSNFYSLATYKFKKL